MFCAGEHYVEIECFEVIKMNLDPSVVWGGRFRLVGYETETLGITRPCVP